MFMFKQEIRTKGMKGSQSFGESLQFVKNLSCCKDFECYIRESENGQNLKSQKGALKPALKIQDLQPMLQAKFYAQLSQLCTDSILADLLEPVEPEPKPTAKKPSKQKAAQKEEPAKPKPKSVVEQQPVVQDKEKKKPKKKKNKKKKKADVTVPTEAPSSASIVEREKEKLSDVASDQWDQCEHDSIQQIAQDLCKYADAASGPEFGSKSELAGGASQLESNDDSVTSSIIYRMQLYNQREAQQKEQLLEMESRLEATRTAEVALENGCHPDDAQIILNMGKRGYTFKEYEDSNSDDNQTIQKMLLGGTIHESEHEMRFKEERTGLLSNQVHLDKYHTETMHELEQIERRRNSPTAQSFEMLEFVLQQNEAANNKVKNIRKLSPLQGRVEYSWQAKHDVRRHDLYAQKLYEEVERGKPQPTKLAEKVIPVLADQTSCVSADDDSPTMKELKLHYQLLGKNTPLPNMNNKQKKIVLEVLKSELRQKQQALAEQSGSGPNEQSKPVTETAEPQKPEDTGKKKSKKQKKKNRRPQKAVTVDTKATIIKPAEKPAISLPSATEQPESIVDDVEEVILVEDSASQSRKRDKSVLRNNFLTEDVPKVNRVPAVSASVMILDANDQLEADKEEVLEREEKEYVKSITTKLIQSAVQSCTESPKPQTTVPARGGKAGRRKGKVKQEMQFQQKTKQPEKSEKPEKKAAAACSGLSQLSSDAASTGKGVPVYCATPILNKETKTPASVVSFKADLSESVKIPKRGTSNSSYGKEEKFHEQTLLELDSLFPSGKKESSSGSSLKIRSSTLSKDRLSSMGNGNKNQIFEKTARLTNLNTNFGAQNDDVQSQKIVKSKPDQDAQPCSPLLAKALAKVDLKGSLRIERPETKVEEKPVEQPKAPTKAQKKQLKKQRRQAQLNAQLQIARDQTPEQKQTAETTTEAKEAESEQIVAKTDQLEVEPPRKQEGRVESKQRASYQAKDAKTGPQYVPKAVQVTNQQTQQPKQQPATKVAPVVVVNEPVKSVQAQPAKEQKAQPKQNPEAPANKKDPKAILKPAHQTFTSFDSMFESVYGAQAISGIIVQAQDKPKVAIEIEPDSAKKRTKDQPAKPTATKPKATKTEPGPRSELYEIKAGSKAVETTKGEPVEEAEQIQKMKKGVNSIEAVEDGKNQLSARGQMVNFTSSSDQKPKTTDLATTDSHKPPSQKIALESGSQLKAVQQTKQQIIKTHQQQQQYTVSSVQTPTPNSFSHQTHQVYKQVSQTSFTQQDNTYMKRNRGAQFPPSTLGNSVTSSTPTVASNGSQTINLQQISNQQQQTQYTVNLNIVNTTNQFVTPIGGTIPQLVNSQAGYLTPQQQLMQQQQMQQYMQMMAQQQQFGAQPYGMTNFNSPMMMPQYQVPNYGGQFIRQMPPLNIAPGEHSFSPLAESKEEVKGSQEQQEPAQSQQKMNQSGYKASPTETTTSTPRTNYQLPVAQPGPQNMGHFQRPMMPVQYGYYSQKPVQPMYSGPMYPVYVQPGMYQPVQASYFNYGSLFARLQGSLARSEGVHYRLSEPESYQVACKFFTQLGKQVLKIQSKIETRLSQIEEYKEVTFSRIQQIAKQTFSEATNIEFEIYGSMATKLAIDTSDMDIAVYGIIPADKIAQSLSPKDLVVYAMEQLNLRFEGIDWIQNNRVIGTASVPVIKLEIDLAKLAKTVSDTHTLENSIKTLKIDIIFNDVALPRPDTLDISDCQTKRCAEYVKRQITEHPFLKPLVVVLKKYLSLKNLNNSFMGTVSSYGLVLLILALIEDMKKSEPQLERGQAEFFEFHLGKALASFFYIFGECFQTQFCKVNDRNEFTETDDMLGQLNTNGSYVLQIIDPCNDSNNVGKQTYRFEEVQEHLQVTFECLLVRFKDFYNLETRFIDLMRRDQEIDRALRSLPFQHTKPKEDPKTDEEQFSLFADLIDNTERSHFWQACNPMQLMTNLFQRGQAQLQSDLKEGRDLIDRYNRERAGKQQAIFERILLINSDDLSSLLQDEEEERQKVLAQLKKAASLFTASHYDQGQNDVYAGTADIQELLTGQPLPSMVPAGMYQYQNVPYYQGYAQTGAPYNQNYYRGYREELQFQQKQAQTVQVKEQTKQSQPSETAAVVDPGKRRKKEADRKKDA